MQKDSVKSSTSNLNQLKSKVRVGCWFCDRPLENKQKKFCSKQCRDYVGHKNFVKKHKNETREITLNKYSTEYLKKEETQSRFPKEIKTVFREKVYKMKKPAPSTSKKYLPSKTSHGKKRKTEREMWIWFWDVVHKVEPLEKSMHSAYRYYSYIHQNQKFTSNKQIEK